eukprot:Nk52_evm32s1967 gene=Nk52_evmTU32s1967
MSVYERIEKVNRRAKKLSRETEKFSSTIEHFDYVFRERLRNKESPEAALEESKENIREECRFLWTRLTEIQNSYNSMAADGIMNASERISLLKSRENKYKSEIDFLLYNQDSVENDHTLSKVECKDELLKSITQLEQSLSLLRCESDVAKQQLKRLQETNEEMAQLKETLTRRAGSLNAELSSGSTVNGALEQKRKEKQIVQSNTILMQQMSAFFNKYYPSPNKPISSLESPSPIKRKRKRHGKEIYFNGKGFCALQTILEEIMNSGMVQPHDPYIPIRDDYYPPYVELLVRSGIAEYHPNNSNLIKLVGFHI